MPLHFHYIPKPCLLYKDCRSEGMSKVIPAGITCPSQMCNTSINRMPPSSSLLGCCPHVNSQHYSKTDMVPPIFPSLFHRWRHKAMVRYLSASGRRSNIEHSARRVIRRHCKRVCAPVADSATRVSSPCKDYHHCYVSRLTLR